MPIQLGRERLKEELNRRIAEQLDFTCVYIHTYDFPLPEPVDKNTYYSVNDPHEKFTGYHFPNNWADDFDAAFTLPYLSESTFNAWHSSEVWAVEFLSHNDKFVGGGETLAIATCNAWLNFIKKNQELTVKWKQS